MVAFADRDDVEGFGVHDTVTVPEPVPLAGDAVSQDPFPDAVQLPPVQGTGEPVTATLRDPPAGPTAAAAGLIEKPVHGGGGAPACWTVKEDPEAALEDPIST
jgi:hypothetical protein